MKISRSYRRQCSRCHLSGSQLTLVEPVFLTHTSGTFTFAGLLPRRDFYVAPLRCIFSSDSTSCSLAGCLDKKPYLLLSFSSVRNMAFHRSDSSQMAVTEPHRWSYLRRNPPTPHQRHADGSVHLPFFKPGGRH